VKTPRVPSAKLELRDEESEGKDVMPPTTAHADLAKRYGGNKRQYQVHPLVESDYKA
jgi:hypothetical protein